MHNLCVFRFFVQKLFFDIVGINLTTWQVCNVSSSNPVCGPSKEYLFYKFFKSLSMKNTDLFDSLDCINTKTYKAHFSIVFLKEIDHNVIGYITLDWL